MEPTSTVSKRYWTFEALKPKALLAVCAAFVVLCAGAAHSATITNILDGNAGILLYNLAVNLGDTVVWVNQQWGFLGSNYVASYGGDWKSPLLAKGDSFAVTFTNAGFFAYETGTSRAPYSGVITVRAWSQGPPPVTLNAPVEGSVLTDGVEGFIQASATNQAETVQMDYYANSNIVATVTNAPFGFLWYEFNPGRYTLLAKATDIHGNFAWSEPVHVTVTGDDVIWGGRTLPTGEFLFFYTKIQQEPVTLLRTDMIPSVSFDLLDFAYVPGLYVDASRKTGAPQHFYYIGPQ